MLFYYSQVTSTHFPLHSTFIQFNNKPQPISMLLTSFCTICVWYTLNALITQGNNSQTPDTSCYRCTAESQCLGFLSFVITDLNTTVTTLWDQFQQKRTGKLASPNCPVTAGSFSSQSNSVFQSVTLTLLQSFNMIHASQRCLYFIKNKCSSSLYLMRLFYAFITGIL